APPSPPAVTVPRGRVPTGQSVNYTCRSDGFTPQNVTVAWMKGGDRIPAAQTDVLPGTDGMFSLRSTATVTLHRQDLLSHVTCLIQHQALSSPLNGTLPLSDIITVSPQIKVWIVPQSPQTNQTVTAFCRVAGFYPAGVTVTWLENGESFPVEPQTETHDNDGTYSVTYSVTRSLRLRQEANYTCRVAHRTYS
ncbi:hypothetical protein FKM82_027521, partial [Ascaphus truei]